MVERIGYIDDHVAMFQGCGPVAHVVIMVAIEMCIRDSPSFTHSFLPAVKALAVVKALAITQPWRCLLYTSFNTQKFCFFRGNGVGVLCI